MSDNTEEIRKLGLVKGALVKGKEISFQGDLHDYSFEDQKWTSVEFFSEDQMIIKLVNVVFKDVFFDSVSFYGIHFINCSFINCSARILNFNESVFKDCRFEKNDFAGSGFFQAEFDNNAFFSSDFSCSFFEKVNFKNSSFNDFLLSASCFEDTEFIDNSYESLTMNSVEGLSVDLIKKLTADGVKISLPVEILFYESIFKFLKLIPLWLWIIAVFFTGYYLARQDINIKDAALKILKRKSCPFNPLFKYSSFSENKDFFINNFPLPNSGFENNMEHWLVVGDDAVMSNGELTLDYKNFVSFPASLSSRGFKGEIYYSRDKEPRPKKGKKIIERKDVWLAVNPLRSRYKVSFHYMHAHPKVTIIGRLKEGGLKILSDIGKKEDESSEWIYYAESIPVDKNIVQVAIKLSDFPDRALRLDEVFVEKTV